MIEHEPRVPSPAVSAPTPKPAACPPRPARTVIQARLRVGASDDPFEREAERVARAFGGAPATSGDGGVEIGSVGPAGGAVTREVEAEVGRIRRRGGRPLDEPARSALERFFDRDLADVRIHASGAAARVSRAMGATAFTSGPDIFFDADRYQPGRAAGNHLLAHEVTHVIQQGGGRIARSTARRPAVPAGADEAGPRPVARTSVGAFATPDTRIRRTTAPGGVSVRQTAPVGLVQRNAATWATWATSALPTETHTFADAGGMIVVDNALDATEAFLQDLRTNDEAKLKRIVATAQALEVANFDPSAMPTAAKKLLTEFQKSKNERMRFRAAIGPTPLRTSLVETFITNVITPAWAPDLLPPFLTAMSPVTRGRMFELAKSSAAEGDKTAGLKWAKAQGAATVSELVNYTEYHIARKDEVASQTASLADEAFKKKALVGGITVVADTDPLVTAEAKRLATIAEQNVMMRSVGPKVGKAAGGKLTDADVADLGKIGVVVTKAAKRPELMAAVDLAIKTKVDDPGYDLTPYRPGAKQSIQRGLDDAELEALTKIAAAKVAVDLGAEFGSETAAVATAGYTGTGPVVPGWTGLPDTGRGAAISAVAKTQKIPFFSASGAAYHSLKHYGDLLGTQDEAATEPGKMGAYLASSTKTIAEPTAPVERQFGQLYETPSYFFIRTVPAKVGGSGKKMRAIVSVDAGGHVNIATYFQAV